MRRLLLLCSIPWVLATGCGSGRTEVKPPPVPRNLLLITLDTTRADHLGAYGYSRPTSPAIDRLSEEAVQFERAYSTSSWTLPSITSMMTGHWAATHRCVRDSRSLSEDFETLAERLQGAGFATAAVVTHIYLDRRYGLAQGFEDYDQALVLETAKASQFAVSSPDVTAKAVAWLEARAREPDVRWFLWLHYFDPHHAYLVHPGVSESFGAEDDVDRYDGEIAFTDAHLGELLDALERLALADRTILALVADHGEEFGDHGGRGHRHTLYDELIRVPLLLRVPGFSHAHVSTPVSTVDALPTFLELLELQPAADLPGRSLLPLMRGEVAGEERALLAELDEKRLQVLTLIVGNWKLVHDRLANRTALFDLETDPLERTDLSTTRPDLVLALRDRLEQSFGAARAAGKPFREAARVELAPEENELLQNLGYAGDEDEDD